MSEDEIRECLRRFGEAWCARDVSALLSLMTEDAVYAASVGPEPGRTYRGHRELAAGFREMFDHDAGAVVEAGEPAVFDGRAVAGWVYRIPTEDGSTRIERGIDLWEFREGKVSLKDAYRKTRR